MAVTTLWRHLEARSDRRTCQLFINGRNLKVWQLVQPIVTGSRTIEEMAADYRLPVDAVREALSFFYENEREILREVEHEGDLLRDAGLIPA